MDCIFPVRFHLIASTLLMELLCEKYIVKASPKGQRNVNVDIQIYFNPPFQEPLLSN